MDREVSVPINLKASVQQGRVNTDLVADYWSRSESADIWHADSFYVNKCRSVFFYFK